MNEKYVELVWTGKYDSLQKGKPYPLEKSNMPFEPLETINVPRVRST